MNCSELRLSEIVRIAIFLASASNISVPRNVCCNSVATATPFSGSPVLSFALTPDTENEARLSLVPTRKITNARQAGGTIYTHDLQMSVENPPTSVSEALNALAGKDFHVLYTHADGSKSVSYSLPNASNIDMEANLSSVCAMTLKAKLLSMSDAITITTP